MFFVRIEGNAMGSKIIHELFLFSDDGYEYEYFFFENSITCHYPGAYIFVLALNPSFERRWNRLHICETFLLLSFSRLEWWRTWASLAVAWYWPSVPKYCEEKLILLLTVTRYFVCIEFVLSVIVSFMNKPHGYPGLDCISVRTPTLPKISWNREALWTPLSIFKNIRTLNLGKSSISVIYFSPIQRCDLLSKMNRT